MKKLIFAVVCSLALTVTSCREEKKKEVVKEEDGTSVSIETSEGSIKKDKDGDVEIKVDNE